MHDSYEKVLFITENSILYLDPPYLNTFSDYNK